MAPGLVPGAVLEQPMKDTRHALGDGAQPNDLELELPHPFEFGPKRPPKSSDMGTPNPEINERRPIARLHPDLGPGNLQEGIAFRTPMGEPYDD